MNNYSIRIEVEDGKVEEILDRLFICLHNHLYPALE